jgi:YVTN family beta-propeller protein
MKTATLKRPALGTILGLLALIVALLLCVPDAQAREAFVANAGSISVFDTATNLTVGAPLPIVANIGSFAITPDGKIAYAADGPGTEDVSMIDTATNQFLGAPIKVGEQPEGVAITPDGHRAYVTNEESDSVSIIDTQTNQVIGTPIKVGNEPEAIAITPDGRTAYVGNFGSESISVIDTATNQVIGTPIKVGHDPISIAITPDGRTAYVGNFGSESISVIDTATNQVVGSPIKIKTTVRAIAISPDGRTLYVADVSKNAISVVDTSTKQVVGQPIEVGELPMAIAVTPDGRTVYSTDYGTGAVFVMDAQTKQVSNPSIKVGNGPKAISITPDQPPRASFSVPRVRPGVPASFNASASSDPDGTIGTYDWSFGDGQTASGGPSLEHTYAKAGTYRATLDLIDNEGCSTAFVFTGQTASCNGGASASAAQTIAVSYPGVRVKCPKKARPGGCKLKLQAVARKLRRGKKGKAKPKAESAVTKAKVKAGGSRIVLLKPKKAFAAKLAAAKRVLVIETATIGGSTRTSYPELKIVR